MRVVLFTGKGGVGKTTVAAATGAVTAQSGRKTLVLSTDPAHSLGDAFGEPIGVEPAEVASGLFVGHIDTQHRLQENWGQLQQYVVSVLGSSGLDAVRAEELTVLPGVEELLALLEVRDHVRSGRWDAVVVDCAPTAETLRLLALPDAVEWYLTKALPIEARVVRSLRPFLGGAMGLPTPNAEVWEALELLRAELADVQDVMRSPSTTVRLVLTPEAVVVSEARRALTQLSLFGYRVDGVVANRVFEPGDDPWRAGWAQAQQRLLADVDESFHPLPVTLAPYQPGEPIGVPALTALGEQLYGDSDPLREADEVELMTVSSTPEGYLLSLALPLVQKDELELTRVGADLVLTVSGRRRVLALPSVLRRCHVTGARTVDGGVEVSFRPDRDQFPEAHP